MNARTSNGTLSLEGVVGDLLVRLFSSPAAHHSPICIDESIAREAVRERLDGFLLAHIALTEPTESARRLLHPRGVAISLERLSQSSFTIALARTLNQGNFEHAFFKGSALSAQLGEVSSLRSAGDIDVLVSPDNVPEAIDYLTKHGYYPMYKMTPKTSLGWKIALFRAREFPLRKEGVEVDLHWRVGSEPDLMPGPDLLFRRKTLVQLTNYPVVTVSELDTVGILAVQALNDRCGNMRHLVDFVMAANHRRPNSADILPQPTRQLVADVAKLTLLVLGPTPGTLAWSEGASEKNVSYLEELYRTRLQQNRGAIRDGRLPFRAVLLRYQHLRRYSASHLLLLRLLARGLFFFPEQGDTEPSGGLLRAHIRQWRRVIAGRFESGI